jgi:hypothetical protein
MLTDVMDSSIQARTTHFKIGKAKDDFTPVIGVYTGLAYTVIAVIATVIYYS